MKIEQLQPLVIEWAKDKGILDKGNPIAQARKTEEEVHELLEAVGSQHNGNTTFTNSKGFVCYTDVEIKDAFGDILVTIIIGAEMQNLTLDECLESAYNVISKRTGKMINGQFVKDEK